MGRRKPVSRKTLSERAKRKPHVLVWIPNAMEEGGLAKMGLKGPSVAVLSFYRSLGRVCTDACLGRRTPLTFNRHGYQAESPIARGWLVHTSSTAAPSTLPGRRAFEGDPLGVRKAPRVWECACVCAAIGDASTISPRSMSDLD